MTRTAAAIACLVIASAACGKESAETSGSADTTTGAKAPATATTPAAQEAKAPAKDTPAKAAPGAKAGDGSPDMARVHEYLRAGKKLQAVREYRELHNKLALNASSLGVDAEATRLGLPSMDRARTLYFKGKTDAEIEAMIEKTFATGKSTPEGTKRLLGAIKEIGPASEDNLKAKVAAGKTTAALAIYHHLHPDVSIPEAWKAITAMKAQ